MGNGSYLKGNESYIREMDSTSSKWIVHYGNESYVGDMDSTSSKWIVHYGNESYVGDMDRSSREMDRTFRELGPTGNMSYLKGNAS